ncbi:MAG: response regulator [Anaerolineae bacterium]|nr:response regulator [Anaerolineae bacterium]
MTDAVRHRVLYIEDDENQRVAMSQMLKILGYEVTCAENGQEGVEKAASWKPDIVLTDVRMPKMNGDEVIRVLRSRPETCGLPIFVISAFTDAKTRGTCKEAGANKFYAKPINIYEINDDIKSALNHKKPAILTT